MGLIAWRLIVACPALVLLAWLAPICILQAMPSCADLVPLGPLVMALAAPILIVAQHPCFAGVTCTDLTTPQDGFTCGACPSGMFGDGTICNVSTDCSVNPCGPGYTCVNVTGGPGYKCDCIDGSCGNPSCQSLPSPCHTDQICVNSTGPFGGFMCVSCPTGTQLVGTTCVDIDSCTPNPCFAGVACTDLKSPLDGFQCGPCPGGTTGDGITCVTNSDCSSNPCSVSGRRRGIRLLGKKLFVCWPRGEEHLLLQARAGVEEW